MGKGSLSNRGLKGGHAITATSTSPRTPPGRRHWICTEDLTDPDDSGFPKGLKNVGNSCYANAALQCVLNTALAHALTDPVASAIFRRYSSNPNILAQGSGSVDSEEDCTTTASSTISQSSGARRKHIVREQKRLDDQAMYENCQWLTQELRHITMEYLAPDHRAGIWLYGPPDATVINPSSITRYPHRLCSSLKPYQQEDAHEFLRALLGTLVMHGQNKELSSLFDGLLESAVTCQVCFRPSLTRDRYMDLSLDIADPGIKTLKDALQDFTATETLSGDNAVYCRHCECKRTASKGLRLATAPSILVCHFKRFAYDEYGRLVRLKKKVKFPLRLEIGDFMSKVNKARPPPYELVSVLVHQGNTCESGHYLAYVKHGGFWYRCNDALVEQVDVETVLSQQAYILMYEVAEMREKHGFSIRQSCAPDLKRNRGISSSKQSDNDEFSFFSPDVLLCGMNYDTTIFSDLCHYARWGRPVRNNRRSSRRKREQSHDDLTLCDSTVESSDTARRRFRRSSSSGNLRGMGPDSTTYATRSMSVSARHRRDEPRDWTATSGARSSRRNSELPPRPGSHRRVLSSEGVQ